MLRHSLACLCQCLAALIRRISGSGEQKPGLSALGIRLDELPSEREPVLGAVWTTQTLVACPQRVELHWLERQRCVALLFRELRSAQAVPYPRGQPVPFRRGQCAHVRRKRWAFDLLDHVIELAAVQV